MRIGMKLTGQAEDDRAAFEELTSHYDCSCHISPPCAICVHPGNPRNQEEDDECWEKTKETGILFKGEMVRAILDDRKTMTRRLRGLEEVNRLQAEGLAVKYAGTVSDYHLFMVGGTVLHAKCPYGRPGDRLWVRETWCPACDPVTSQLIWSEDGNTYKVHYRANGYEVVCDDGDGFTAFNKDGTEKSPWRPSIHMFRWMSRITLEVTGVRVERLQEITAADCIAEGIVVSGNMDPCDIASAARDAFRDLWDSINGKTHPWLSNPWVWVLSFRRV
jgi:hypothetical protein